VASDPDNSAGGPATACLIHQLLVIVLKMQAARTFNIHHSANLQGPLQSSRPVLYTHTLCPYAQRVFLALLFKVHTAQS
jgi:hypothetical protein